MFENQEWSKALDNTPNEGELPPFHLPNLAGQKAVFILKTNHPDAANVIVGTFQMDPEKVALYRQECNKRIDMLYPVALNV